MKFLKYPVNSDAMVRFLPTEEHHNYFFSVKNITKSTENCSVCSTEHAIKRTFINAIPVFGPTIKPSRHRSKRILKKIMKRNATLTTYGDPIILSLPQSKVENLMDATPNILQIERKYGRTTIRASK